MCKPCTSLPEPVADCLPTSFSGTSQLSLLSGNPTPARSCGNELQKDGSRACGCGRETLGCSIHPNTPEAWTASMRASLASLLVSLDHEKVRKTREENSSLKSFAVLKQSDPNTSFLKMSQDYSQAEPHLAYAAGLIDGEGCIRIQKQSNKQTYIVVVQLAMTNKAIVIRDELIKTFGGNSYDMEFKNEKWAKQWQWRISGEKACDLLKKILPFLVLKKQQAILALSLNEMRKKDGWTPETRAAAESMKQRMHDLNKKGTDAPSAEAGWYQTSPDLFGTWNRWSQPWPRSGMTRNGSVYELPTVGRTITGTDGGYLPTPVSIDAGTGRFNTSIGSDNHRPTLAMMARKQLWPTPRSCSAMAATITPESVWNMDRFPNLETMVGRKLWPTPVASMSKGSSPASLTRKSGADRSADRLDHAVMASDGGQLNPTWVEWLMGFPIAFTVSRHWVTPKSRCKPQPLGDCSGVSDGN